MTPVRSLPDLARTARSVLRRIGQWLLPLAVIAGLAISQAAPAQAATYWQLLGSSNTVNALALDSGGNLYVGGKVAPYNISKWDGSAWQGLGAANQNVLAVAYHDATGTLYAGGFFTAVDGVSAPYIARRNGSAWSSLGSGMSYAVHALELDAGGALYAGGDFVTAGGIAADHVARWNGSAWQALGSGLNNAVYALETDAGGNLYAGGSFSYSDSLSAARIARWNGSAWSALGSGMNNNVMALAYDNASGTLYAGGYFTTAGGGAANYIAKWNGSTWQPLGSGMNGTVLALALDADGNLYAGGAFTTAGEVPAMRVAKWDGAQWSAVGASTFDYSVRALAHHHTSNNLYAGGDFSGRVARLADDSDITPPTNPAATMAGVTSGEWTGNGNPLFSLSGAADAGAGVAGYYWYFGPDSAGEPAAWTTSATLDLAPVSDGTNYLRVKTQDMVGNFSTPQTVFIFRYDATPPTLPGPASETHGAASGTWQGAVNAPAFTWGAASDALSAVSYDVYFGADPDGTTVTAATGAPAYSPGPQATGTRYLRVRSKDEAGNTSAWTAPFTFRYDGTPPAAPGAATEAGGATSGTWQSAVCQPQFTWEAVADAESGTAGYDIYFGLAENGTAVVTTTASAAYAPGDYCNSDGTYYLRARSVDAVGNTSGWATLFTFRFDGMQPNQPTAEAAGVTSGAWQNTINDPVFTLSASDWQSGIAGYKVCWSTSLGCAPTDFQASDTYSPGPVATGEYFLTVVAVDNVGHASTPWTYLFFFDGTPPAPPGPAIDQSGSASGVWQKTTAAPAFRWPDGAEVGSGLTGFDVYFGPDPNGTGATHFNGLVYSPGAQADGAYYLRARSKDLAGNTSAWTTLYVFNYDATPPGLPGNAADSQGSISGAWQDAVSAPEFTWLDSVDPLSGLAGYRVYWGADPSGTTVITTTAGAAFAPGAQAEGARYLRACAVDAAGNASAWTTLFVFQYDASPPAFAPGYTALADGGVISGTWGADSGLAFTWEASDAGQGVDHYQVYFGPDPAGTTVMASPTAAEHAYTATMAEPGLNYLRLRAVDALGHASNWITAFMVGYDPEAPAAPTEATPPAGVQDGVPQSAVNAPAFTWSGAADAGSGVAGYRVYFGPDPNGAPTTPVAAASYNAPAVGSGTYYLRVVTVDQAGNASAPETLFTFVYVAPPTMWTVHLPLIRR